MKIGIVVPVYKVEKYINKCIESILKQTYSNFVLVLVDDGSPDESGKICDYYAEKDERIKVIHQENAGLSAARNAGIDWIEKKTGCEWITFIDSDDWVHFNYLKNLINVAYQEQINVVICDYLRTTDNDVVYGRDDTIAVAINPEDFWVTNPISASIAWAKMINLNLMKNIRFPVGKIHEDEFTLYKVIFQCEKIAFLPQKLYYYRYNPESITASVWNTNKLAVFEAFDEQISFFRANGYYRAYQERVNLCMESYCTHLYKIEHLSIDLKEVRKRLLKDYRTKLWKYRKEVPIHNNVDKYAVAYRALGICIYAYRKISCFIGKTMNSKANIKK